MNRPSIHAGHWAVKVVTAPACRSAVIDRAKTILAKLESDDTTVSLPAPQAKPKK